MQITTKHLIERQLQTDSIPRHTPSLGRHIHLVSPALRLFPFPLHIYQPLAFGRPGVGSTEPIAAFEFISLNWRLSGLVAEENGDLIRGSSLGSQSCPALCRFLLGDVSLVLVRVMRRDVVDWRETREEMKKGAHAPG